MDATTNKVSRHRPAILTPLRVNLSLPQNQSATRPSASTKTTDNTTAKATPRPSSTNSDPELSAEAQTQKLLAFYNTSSISSLIPTGYRHPTHNSPTPTLISALYRLADLDDEGQRRSGMRSTIPSEDLRYVRLCLVCAVDQRLWSGREGEGWVRGDGDSPRPADCGRDS